MLFNSLTFVIFIIIVIPAYFLLSEKLRWWFLLIVSLYFYMSWNVVYFFLFLFTLVVNHILTLLIDSSKKKTLSKLYLLLSLFFSFGILFLFKYFDYTAALSADIFAYFGIAIPDIRLGLLLPVGISFYTFQMLGYVIDVYNKKIPAERSLAAFALFITFFPQLVAGPIERAHHLMPQFKRKRKFVFTVFLSSMYRILWGFIKKMVIADRLAAFVNPIYSSPREYSPALLILATAVFAFQIYCDFSGYCDIALGVAKIMGFRLTLNFKNPYFAKSISEFWERWHITLSRWFQDYIYIPLGGSRVRMPRYILNVMIVFIVSGVWHGAGLKFLFWGLLHGLMVAFEKIYKDKIKPVTTAKFRRSATYHCLCVFATFTLVNIAWVFFRAQTLSDTMYILNQFLTFNFKEMFLMIFDAGSPLYNMGVFTPFEFWFAAFAVAAMLIIERKTEKQNVFLKLAREPVIAQCAIYVIMLFVIILFGMYGENTVQQFIYFQF